MASRRTKLISAATVATLGIGGYFLYSLFAAQGQGTLAQAPLNTQVQIPPGFIMAVDDSGSMTFHNQFPGVGRLWLLEPDQRQLLHLSRRAQDVRGRYVPVRVFLYRTAHRGDLPRHSACRQLRLRALARLQSLLLRPDHPLPALGEQRRNSLRRRFAHRDPNRSPTDGDHQPRLVARRTRTAGRCSAPTTTCTCRRNRLQAGRQQRANCGGLSNSSGGWLTIGGSRAHDVRDLRHLHPYWPATFFTRYSSDTDPHPQLPGYAGYLRFHSPRPRGQRLRHGLRHVEYRIRVADTDALQNFANWFSFYGNRNRAMVAGMTRRW